MAKPCKPLPAQSYLQECFIYDPVTGIVVWKARPAAHFKSLWHQRNWNARFAGKRCQWQNSEGYIKTKIDGIEYFLHRLIWKFVTGNEPTAQIDHKDGNTGLNTWENLREATEAQNHQNKRKIPANKWGYRGVEYERKRGKFRAAFEANKKRYSVGYFETPYEAHLAYVKKVNEVCGEFAVQKVPAPPPT